MSPSFPNEPLEERVEEGGVRWGRGWRKEGEGWREGQGRRGRVGERVRKGGSGGSKVGGREKGMEHKQQVCN